MRETPNRWFYEYITHDLFLASHLTRIVYVGQTAYQRVEILDTVPFGRILVLDGRTQSSEADEFIYHEALVHPALVTHPEPLSVFIAGGGEGATLREAVSHRSVHRVVMADLDREVVELAQEHLPNHHQGAFQDPRLELRFVDAARYLEETTERFDLVILDIPDPLEGGPAYLLYTREFYTLIRERLRPQGLAVIQAGPCGPLNYHEVFTAMHHTLQQVFPAVYPYRMGIPSFGSQWGFIIASLGPDPTNLSPQEVEARLSREVTRPLRCYDGITHQGLFALPKDIREGLAREERVITKEHPLFAV